MPKRIKPESKSNTTGSCSYDLLENVSTGQARKILRGGIPKLATFDNQNCVFPSAILTGEKKPLSSGFTHICPDGTSERPPSPGLLLLSGHAARGGPHACPGTEQGNRPGERGTAQQRGRHWPILDRTRCAPSRMRDLGGRRGRRSRCPRASAGTAGRCPHRTPRPEGSQTTA